MTTIYLIRHSERLNPYYIEEINSTDSLLVQNEKDILSVEGERRAALLADVEELQDVEKVYTSKCVRTLQTAKYLLNKLDLKATIDERLDERRVGLPNSQAHPDWFIKQYQEIDFKTVGGESQRDVLNRMNEIINIILETDENKKVAIFSHGYAICFYLMQFAKLNHIDLEKNLTLTYKNKNILEGLLYAPEIFKLEYDGKKLKSIENLTYLIKNK